MTTHAAFRLVVISLVALAASAGWADPFMGQYAGTFYPDSVTQMPATAVVVAEGWYEAAGKKECLHQTRFFFRLSVYDGIICFNCCRPIVF